MDIRPNPIARIFRSSKALVMLATAAGSFALVALGKITWDQAERFLTISVPAWMLAVGLEDAARNMADGKK